MCIQLAEPKQVTAKCAFSYLTQRWKPEITHRPVYLLLFRYLTSLSLALDQSGVLSCERPAWHKGITLSMQTNSTSRRKLHSALTKLTMTTKQKGNFCDRAVRWYSLTHFSPSRTDLQRIPFAEDKQKTHSINADKQQVD